MHGAALLLKLQVRHHWCAASQVFLDKTWFGPVGRTLEERDAYLREKLSSVKGDSGELNRLQVPPPLD